MAIAFKAKSNDAFAYSYIGDSVKLYFLIALNVEAKEHMHNLWLSIAK